MITASQLGVDGHQDKRFVLGRERDGVVVSEWGWRYSAGLDQKRLGVTRRKELSRKEGESIAS